MTAATVRRTDCGTGYQVIVSGRVYVTVRRYESAKGIADDMNRKGER